uniref:Uncharacterized protein n=1 Tax=Arundo donax TaxID=35708 RepID=A0A0A9BMK1_ARUDO
MAIHRRLEECPGQCHIPHPRGSLSGQTHRRISPRPTVVGRELLEIKVLWLVQTRIRPLR